MADKTYVFLEWEGFDPDDNFQKQCVAYLQDNGTDFAPKHRLQERERPIARHEFTARPVSRLSQQPRRLQSPPTGSSFQTLSALL